jgi:hypothetical protein
VPCTVNGVTISVTGTNAAQYANPFGPANNCLSMASVDLLPWTGTTATGLVTYTFSQPIMNATIGYSAVNGNDVGRISINGTSPVQLSNPCGVTVTSFNTVQGNFAVNSYGDVGFNVSSATPFTTITLTNIGGQSGWVSGTLCNFTFVCTIVADPKISYFNCLSQFGDLVPSIFTSVGPPITINGVQANANNVTITPVVPTAPYTGVAYNLLPPQAMPDYLTFNTNGTIAVSPTAPSQIDAEFYFILCPVGAGTCTLPIRYNITRSIGCRNSDTNSTVTIQPNPSKDTFVIDFITVKDSVQLEVYDFYGKVYLKTQETKLNSYTINAQDYPKGTYILKIIDGTNVTTKQLIKE